MDAYQILREICKKHEVTLLTFASDEDRRFVPALSAICCDVVTIPVPALPGTKKSVLYTLLSFGSKMPIVARMAHSQRMVACLRELMLTGNFDLVHVEFTQMAHYVRFLAGTSAVIDESDIAFVRRQRFTNTITFVPKRALLQWDTLKLKKYELGFCSEFDAILVRTASDRSLLKSVLPQKKVEVILPWVDFSFADRVAGESDGEDLLFYGAMWRPVNEQAAIYFIERILPLVQSRLPEQRFVILGSRPTARLRKMGSRNITVCGFVEDIAPFYQRTAVVVVPLLSGAGIKGKVLQALGCGKPVVTTSVGAEGISASEADGLFVRDDPADFAECVLWLLGGKRHLQFRGAARAFIKKDYDWLASIRRLEDVYAEVARRQHPPTIQNKPRLATPAST
jgi:glycosyltransferase involved in cell wall biosynthesis